ncbi:hypothetical protein QAD02_022247 [Eretmocerus hayati]|uniref:Uncharacterized protein n=1 Tax=Eretmocerus hayati TaxID=131215 RepID=A0ACC2PSJ1_9HYME|nr:hypothetical protein QAD02_022247 [Eretmocerus hayati]
MNYRFVESNEGKQENSLYLNVGASGLRAKVTYKSFERSTDTSFYLPSENSHFISIGCNILLTRYLALTNFSGSLTLDFISSSGEAVKCDYECSHDASMENNGNKMNAYMIRQKIYNNSSVMHQNQSFLTKHGKILCFDWINTAYMMRMNSLLGPHVYNEHPILMPLKAIWKEDLELMSNYLDKMAREVLKNEEYLSSYPQIVHLLGDYVKSLISRKPNDVLTFTIKYFITFGRLEHTEEDRAQGFVDSAKKERCQSAGSSTNTGSSKCSEVDEGEYIIINWNNDDYPTSHKLM